MQTAFQVAKPSLNLTYVFSFSLVYFFISGLHQDIWYLFVLL